MWQSPSLKARKRVVLSFSTKAYTKSVIVGSIPAEVRPALSRGDERA